VAVTSTAAHVGFPWKLGRPRIDWLGATFKSYVKMEGRGRPHPSFSTIAPLRDHLHSPFISTTHFHVRENLKKTPAWPSFIGYVGVCFLGAG
jgi:hypothetical protein